jgi:hypothetical protein
MKTSLLAFGPWTSSAVFLAAGRSSEIRTAFLPFVGTGTGLLEGRVGAPRIVNGLRVALKVVSSEEVKSSISPNFRNPMGTTMFIPVLFAPAAAAASTGPAFELKEP